VASNTKHGDEVPEEAHGHTPVKGPNEPVEKVLLTSESDVFAGHLTLPKHMIVDCGAFCEVFFFCISPKNLLGDFFYSPNVYASPAALQNQLRASGACDVRQCGYIKAAVLH
jgi:hypothetical protein